MTRTRPHESDTAVEVESKDEIAVDHIRSANELNGEMCPDQPLTVRVESLLFNTDRPIGEGKIAEMLGISGKGSSKTVVAAIEELNDSYEKTSRSFRAERLAGGWQLLTLSSLGPLLNRMHTDRQQSKLSQPALETLAIISYRQPIMRAEIEAIRGVASGEVLRGLLERRLIKIAGRAEVLGRPMLYGTTKEFLKVFGLSGLDDLPTVKGLAPSMSAAASTPTATSKPESVDEAATEESTADQSMS